MAVRCAPHSSNRCSPAPSINRWPRPLTFNHSTILRRIDDDRRNFNWSDFETDRCVCVCLDFRELAMALSIAATRRISPGSRVRFGEFKGDHNRTARRRRRQLFFHGFKV
jgi:hypothetical protein